MVINANEPNPFDKNATAGNPFAAPTEFVAANAVDDPKGFWGDLYSGLKHDLTALATSPIESTFGRVRYGANKFYDVLATKGVSHFAEAVEAMNKEQAGLGEKLSFFDVMEHAAPKFVSGDPASPDTQLESSGRALVVGTLATLGDIFGDPMTYLTGGTGKTISAGKLALSPKGVNALKTAVQKVGPEISAMAESFGTLAQPGAATRTIRSVAEGIVESQAVVDQTLVDLGGVKIAGGTVIPGKYFKAASDAMGFTKLKELVKSTDLYQKGGSLLNRWNGLPDEYIQMFHEFTAKLASAEREGVQDAFKVFGTMAKDEAMAVGETGLKINDRTVEAGKLKRAETEKAVQKATDTFEQAKQNVKTEKAEQFMNTVIRDEQGAPKTWFHGSKDDWVEGDLKRGRVHDLYGESVGGYWTDKEVVSQKYANGQRIDEMTGEVLPAKPTDVPQVWKANLAPQKTFDVTDQMDLNLLKQVKASFRLPEDQAKFAAMTTAAGDFKTNDDLYNALVKHFGMDRIGKNEWLREAGYDSISYPGGRLAGKEPHTVMVPLTSEIVAPAFGAKANVVRQYMDAEKGLQTLSQINPALTQAETLKIQRTVLDEAKLNPQQMAAYSRMSQHLKEVGDLEEHLGLLKSLNDGYIPRMYEEMKDASKFNFIQKQKGLGNFLGSSQRRQFDTMAEARAAGLEPILDAGVLYANRLISHRRAIATKDFKDAVYSTFGKGGFDELPNRIKEDVTYVGEGLYPRGMMETRKYWLQAYDQTLNLFKRAATTLRPYFGLKQGLVSNPLQSYLVIGPKAMRAYDPRTVMDAIAILSHDRGVFIDGEKGLGWTVTSAIGEKITGKQFLNEIYANNIVQRTTVTGERLKSSIEEQLSRFRATHDVEGDLDVTKGIGSLLKQTAKYWNFPAQIEDVGRVSLYMNARRIGHGELEAANITRKGLFDYSNGMSEFERRVAKRIVPFYSYQKFVYPLLAETFFKTPGRLLNVNKSIQNFLKTMPKFESGDKLNDSERWALGSWLLEQPNYFAKFDEKSQAVFRTFNNFSFTDNLALMQSDEATGEVDYKRTMEKVILAQLAPVIKAPLELAMNKNFFSDRAITTMGKLGDVSAITDQFPEPVRSYIFENGIDKRTGKKNVFINCYAAYALSNTFPVINDLIRLNKPENTPTEKTLQTLFGINTIKLDLKEQGKYKLLSQKNARDQAVVAARRAYIQGRNNSFDDRMKEYNELIQHLVEDRKQVNLQFGEIRGAEKP